jgi:hypothetical protein
MTPTPIDWSRPVYRQGGTTPLRHMSTNGTNGTDTSKVFRGFLDPEEPERGHIYYNNDGTPFKGAPPISNQPAFDPRQRDMDLLTPEERAREAAMDEMIAF